MTIQGQEIQGLKMGGRNTKFAQQISANYIVNKYKNAEAIAVGAEAMIASAPTNAMVAGVPLNLRPSTVANIWRLIDVACAVGIVNMSTTHQEHYWKTIVLSGAVVDIIYTNIVRVLCSSEEELTDAVTNFSEVMQYFTSYIRKMRTPLFKKRLQSALIRLTAAEQQFTLANKAGYFAELKSVLDTL